MTKDALVGNASDEKQVKKAGNKENLKKKDDAKDLREVLKTVGGRRLMWRILIECNVFNSIWMPSPQIHYMSGKQSIGHWLMAEIESADEDAFLKILKEKGS